MKKEIGRKVKSVIKTIGIVKWLTPNSAVYEEEGAKKEVWLELVEARRADGLTQAQVAKRLGVSQAQVTRIEKQGYDAYTLNALRRHVEALGDDFILVVRVRGPRVEENLARVAMSRCAQFTYIQK